MSNHRIIYMMPKAKLKTISLSLSLILSLYLNDTEICEISRRIIDMLSSSDKNIIATSSSPV